MLQIKVSDFPFHFSFITMYSYAHLFPGTINETRVSSLVGTMQDILPCYVLGPFGPDTSL